MKFDNSIVRSARKDFQRGISRKDIAEKYGMEYSYVTRLLNHRRRTATPNNTRIGYNGKPPTFPIKNGKKRCILCKRILPISEYVRESKGFEGRCKVCRQLYRSYGVQFVNQILAEGKNVYEQLMRACDLCGRKQTHNQRYRHHLDHDHKTGRFRGVLCHNCNAGIGHFQDNPIILKKAIQYLEDRQ